MRTIYHTYRHYRRCGAGMLNAARRALYVYHHGF